MPTIKAALFSVTHQALYELHSQVTCPTFLSIIPRFSTVTKQKFYFSPWINLIPILVPLSLLFHTPEMPSFFS